MPFFCLQSNTFNPNQQFDESQQHQITFAPTRRTWHVPKANSRGGGSGNNNAITRSDSAGYTSSSSSTQRNNSQDSGSLGGSGSNRSSTPTMMNRFSALQQGSGSNQTSSSSDMSSNSRNASSRFVGVCVVVWACVCGVLRLFFTSLSLPLSVSLIFVRLAACLSP